jgi:aryl-alcohol dehydrogenase-like predicted oxidoreductase
VQWDTANVYSNGRSEEIIGKALRKYGIPRQKVVIMTKVGRIMADDQCRNEVVAFMDVIRTSCKDYVNSGGRLSVAIIM